MDRQSVRALLTPVLRAREVPGRPLAASDWDRVAQVFGRRPPDSFVAFVELLTEFHCWGASMLGAAPGQAEDGDFESVLRFERETPTGWPQGLVPFWEIGNGDYLALDLRRSDGAPVVLRDHADGSVQEEYPDFESFLRALPGALSDEDRR
jgi:hypothetical protein